MTSFVTVVAKARLTVCLRKQFLDVVLQLTVFGSNERAV